MSGGRKRSHDEAFKLVSGLKGPPAPQTFRYKVKATDTWSKLTGLAIDHAHAVFEHGYKRLQTIGGLKAESVATAHTHGEFNNILRDDGHGHVGTTQHNISTKRVDTAARSHDALFDLTGDDHGGVSNILRVIKGTHHSKGLTGSQSKAQAAVEFGTEIGVSELARGGKSALLHAAETLYLLKHRVPDGDGAKFKRADFLNPKYGFQGSGEGGAGRLRKLADDPGALLSWHEKDLQRQFKSHAQKKPRWKDASFDEWRAHKIAKWTQKA